MGLGVRSSFPEMFGVEMRLVMRGLPAMGRAKGIEASTWW